MAKLSLDQIVNGVNPKFYTIGQYELIGEIFIIDSYKTSNIYCMFCYDKYNHKYLLIKEFKSNKVHIDFFDDPEAEGLLFHKNEKGLRFISANYDSSKQLFFDFKNDKKAYILRSITEGKIYESTFRKKFLIEY